MKAVPTVTLHRASLAHASKIIKDNLEAMGKSTEGIGVLSPYPASFAAFFQALSKSLGIPLSSPGVYISAVNNALKPVRALMLAGSVEPPIPITADYLSAEVPVGSNGSYINVTLTDIGQGSATPEWSIKVEGVDYPILGVDGGGSAVFMVATTVIDSIVAGNTVTVSHTEGSGIAGFIDQPVDNNLVAPPVIESLDLDKDGLPDTKLVDLETGGMVTEDADSTNFDFTGDGEADAIIPKK